MVYCRLFLIWAALAFGVSAAETLVFSGGEGPGKGKHIVLIAGDEEYRSEESMPMLGKILAKHHGFDCTVVFSWSEDGTYIDPNNQKSLHGLSALENADLMLIGTRFRQPPPEEAAHVTGFLNAGKPVIGIRTATHAFTGKGKFGDSLPAEKFGLKILGEQWVNHHGGHKREGARGVINKQNANNPVLRSVKNVFGPSDVYGVKHLTDDNKILLWGAVTETLDPDSNPVEGAKNNPMQALAWLHNYTAPDGKTKGKAFCTTAGASVDLVNEDLRRLLVNATYHLTGLEVPAEAKVDYVDPFYPSFYGFITEKGYWKKADMQAVDYGLGKTPHLPDPKGSPEWKFRPVPEK